MAFADLATGSDFGGRYRVLRRLASGGMGTVYEVVHLETERRRALKVMQADLFQNAGLRERFRNEARVTAQVRSESLVDVFDAGVDAATGMPFLVMELLVGEDLGRRLERQGPRPPDEVVAHLTQVASALDKTHAASIVHRDLKPANLFLAELEGGSSRVKILDFGISKIVSEATSDGATSHSLGTPAYMAPEQLLGEPVSAATDIHALGLIAYTLLVGDSYWQEDVESVDNVFAFALRAQEGPRENPLERAARRGRPLPAAFGRWFERATARDPQARFSRASTAIAALAEAVGAGPGTQPAPVAAHGLSVDTPALPGERPVFAGVRFLAIVAAALVLVGIAFLLRNRAETRAETPARPVASQPGEAGRSAPAVVANPSPNPVAPRPIQSATATTELARELPDPAESARESRMRIGRRERTATRLAPPPAPSPPPVSPAAELTAGQTAPVPATLPAAPPPAKKTPHHTRD